MRDHFYNQLDSLLKKIGKQVTLFIAGDFNSKIGHEWMNTKCIGRYCRGLRNSNGQQLFEFCESFQLIAKNTCFAHRACHRTTWTGQRLDATKGEKVPIYNQIDYILTPRRQFNLVTNARSYSGTITESDHRLLVTTTTTKPAYKRIFGPNSLPKQNKYNMPLLVNDSNVRIKYQTELNNKISSSTANESAFEKWVSLRMNIIQTADEIIGTVKKRKGQPECPVTEQLSEQQHSLRIQIANTSCETAIKRLKTRRNNISTKSSTRQLPLKK